MPPGRPRLSWPGAAASALLAAALACAPAGAPPDIPATVNAVSTQVQLTLAAQGSPAPTTAAPSPSAATPAQPPPASVTPPAPVTPPAAATLTATPERLRGDGLLFRAPRLSARPRIDGSLDEWALLYSANQAVFRPENWAGPGDLSAEFAVAWDEGLFYLAARVTDDTHAQTQNGASLYQGDSLELLIDTDLGGDFADASLSGDDVQLGLSPGETGRSPEAYLWFPQTRAGSAGEVQLAVELNTGGGYVLEAAIPWHVLGAPPQAGLRLGFAFSASDNDDPTRAGQETLVSTALGRRLTNPTTWSTLVLEP